MSMLDDYGLSLEDWRINAQGERPIMWFSLRQLLLEIAADDDASKAIGTCIANAEWQDSYKAITSEATLTYTSLADKIADDPAIQVNTI